MYDVPHTVCNLHVDDKFVYGILVLTIVGIVSIYSGTLQSILNCSQYMT